MQPLTPARVKDMLSDGQELAFVDLREELTFSQNHLLHARSIPLSHLELRFAALVPRLATRIVLCDGQDGLVERAGQILSHAGYSNIFYLQGGVAAWAAAGFDLFSGVNVPSKAFGEFVEHTSGTPSIDAGDLDRLLREGANMVVLDSRPFNEYARVSIPTSTNVPGAELVLRVRDIVPSPETMIVVNCAGRTRSIIGAQSLINAGVPNKVVALRNGTMGWSLAGLACDSGKNNRAPKVSGGGLAWAKAAASRVAERLGIERIDRAMLDHFRTEQRERTLYVLDVRDPAEYETGHFPGAISAPGGQLVQATDQYVGTLGARIVLVDDAEVRAVMTASWLRQMGWKDVFVLVEKGSETGQPAIKRLGPEPQPELRMDCKELSSLLARNGASVVDLSLSPRYCKGHIPGAFFAIRSRLAKSLKAIPAQGMLVLTSEDGTLAGLAAPEAQQFTKVPVHFLTGGNAAWQAAGYPLTADDPRMADEPVDVWLKPYERPNDTAKAMADYLSWEVDLISRIERDGSCNFIPFR